MDYNTHPALNPDKNDGSCTCNLSSSDIKRIVTAIINHCKNCTGEMMPACGTISNVAKKSPSQSKPCRGFGWRQKTTTATLLFTHIVIHHYQSFLPFYTLKWDKEAIIEEIASLKSHQQRTIHAIAHATSIPKQQYTVFTEREILLGMSEMTSIIYCQKATSIFSCHTQRIWSIIMMTTTATCTSTTTSTKTCWQKWFFLHKRIKECIWQRGKLHRKGKHSTKDTYRR
jgi:hypothetical protein